MNLPENLQKSNTKSWFDDRRNVRKIIWTLCIVCSGLFAADGFYEKHPLFAAESVFGFYAIYGFVMCIGLVLVAKWMRTILMRNEDYYIKQNNDE